MTEIVNEVSRDATSSERRVSSQPREEDRFDNVEVSEENSASPKNSKNSGSDDERHLFSASEDRDDEGEELGKFDTEDDEEQDDEDGEKVSGGGFIVNDNNKRTKRAENSQKSATRSRTSNDDDDNDDDDDDDEENDEDGRKKQRRAPPSRRAVKNDDIEACFLPVGVVPNKPLSVLGLSLCNVQVVKEFAVYDSLKAMFSDNELPKLDAVAKRYREKNDFFEDQSRIDAPRPIHHCQETRSANFVAAFPKERQREIFQRALKEAQSVASAPKRCLVYCVVTFSTAEEARAHSSPFLMYPIKGRLSKSCMSTTNWQSATEFPTDALDKYNASANSALMTEQNWACSVIDKRPLTACTARQPIVENALFEIAFEAPTAFGVGGSKTPIVYNLRFSLSKRAGPHDNIVSLERSLTSKRFGDTLRRTNYLLNLKDETKPDHQRKIGYLPTRCEYVCAKNRQACLLLLAKQRTEFLKRQQRTYLRWSVQKNLMVLDDIVFLLRKNYTETVAPQTYVFEVLKCVLLPALVQPSFWHIVELVGFDNATIMLMEDIDKKFVDIYGSECPQLLLIHTDFYPYKLHENVNFVRSLAAKLAISEDAVRRYARLSDCLLEIVESVPTDCRFISRPDVDATVRRLCWPANEISPIAAIELSFDDDAKSSFVTTRSLMQQDCLLALSLALGFDRNVTLLRSDDTETLHRLMYEHAINGSFTIVIASSEEEENEWRSYQKHFPQLVVYPLREYTDKRFAAYLLSLKKLDDGDAWNAAIPRADRIPYSVLSRLLATLCVKKPLTEKRLNDWCRAMFFARDLDDWTQTTADFSAGFCKGGKLFVGGLAFQVAEHNKRSGSLVDDLYFSGQLDNATFEQYSVVDRYLEDALEFEQADEDMVDFNPSDDDYVERLTKKRLAFSRNRRNEGQRVALTYLDWINKETKDDMTLFLRTQTLFGTISSNMEAKVAANCRDQLPCLENPLATNGYIAIVFDTVLDNEFLTINDNVNAEYFDFGYNLSSVPRVLNEKLTDQVLRYHRGWKSNLRSGLSLGGMISLHQARPRSILVFGSARQSIENRVTAQPSPPWFLKAPSKNGEGRRWFHNSEAAELSVLTWILASVWTK